MMMFRRLTTTSLKRNVFISLTNRQSTINSNSFSYNNSISNNRYYSNNNNNNKDEGLTFESQKNQHKIQTTTPPPSTPSTPSPSSTQTPLIYDLNYDTFEKVVIHSVPPVMLICYSHKNSYSQQLVTQSEQLAISNPGKFVVAKVDVDQYPRLGQSLQIKELPTVFSLYKGKVLKQFTGNPPADKLKEWVDDLLSNDESNLNSVAEKFLKEEKIDQAYQVYMQMMHNDEDRVKAVRGILDCSIRKRNMEAVKHMIELITTDYPKELTTPLLLQAKTLIDLQSEVEKAKSTSGGGGEEGKTTKQEIQETLQQLEMIDPKIVENKSKIIESRYHLALLYYQDLQYQNAIDQLLLCIRLDKKYNDEAARRLLFKIFDTLGNKDPIVIKSRQRFSSLWVI
ncbi:hypothetical protein DFA_09179 [Cavenderia fasciculata]|uniref:Thioredoxin domain-containing protein n=1 Tax=Cavenderia fasciculata TaxID=261658 RepID=F4Q6X2_CACFS|nr:uncharacterized protein DFA_09179 [Cavenderia fasciculata]EGG16154.1 hypothetical protein DFA_09179 [Cavenderia fasciculata]|eukprot:XP_004352607.1 hypothetical protein DFA_09179 [Cavenderia fasciculata]